MLSQICFPLLRPAAPPLSPHTRHGGAGLCSSAEQRAVRAIAHLCSHRCSDKSPLKLHLFSLNGKQRELFQTILLLLSPEEATHVASELCASQAEAAAPAIALGLLQSSLRAAYGEKLEESRQAELVGSLFQFHCRQQYCQCDGNDLKLPLLGYLIWPGSFQLSPAVKEDKLSLVCSRTFTHTGQQ